MEPRETIDTDGGTVSVPSPASSAAAVAGSRGMELNEAGRALCIALACVGLLTIGFVAGVQYAGESPPIQTFDTRVGQCGQSGCEEYLIVAGKEVHGSKCKCAACQIYGVRKELRHYTQLICPVGHHRMAPASE